MENLSQGILKSQSVATMFACLMSVCPSSGLTLRRITSYVCTDSLSTVIAFFLKRELLRKKIVLRERNSVKLELCASNRGKLCPKAKTGNVFKWTSNQDKAY